MDSSTKRVIDNIKRLEQMGGEIAVVTPVFYARNASQKEILLHFEEISRQTQLSVVLYNIPLFTQSVIEPDTIYRLAEMDNIIGLKDSSGNMAKFQKCLQHFRNRSFRLFQGATDLAGTSILLGAHGMVPVLAPLFPEVFLKLYACATAGDIAGMSRMQEAVSKIGRILTMAPNATSAAKYAISLLGLCNARPARPTLPLTAEEAEQIRTYTQKLQEERMIDYVHD